MRKVNYYIIFFMDDCKTKDQRKMWIGGLSAALLSWSHCRSAPGTRRRSLLKRFAPASHCGGLNGRERAPHPLPSCRPAAHSSLASNKQTLNIYSGMPPNMCPQEREVSWRTAAIRTSRSIHVEYAIFGNDARRSIGNSEGFCRVGEDSSA